MQRLSPVINNRSGYPVTLLLAVITDTLIAYVLLQEE